MPAVFQKIQQAGQIIDQVAVVEISLYLVTGGGDHFLPQIAIRQGLDHGVGQCPEDIPRIHQ